MNPSTVVETREGPWARAWGALVDADPVLAKEILVTVRTPAYARSIVAVPVVLTGLVLVASLTSLEVPGRVLFSTYVTGLAVLLGLLGAGLGSTVVVQEREANALEALKFSSLSPRRISLGKFLAVILAQAAVVVGTLPSLAIILASKDVSIGETCVALAIAFAGGVMTASIGIAVSAHAPHTRQALLAALLGAFLVGIGVTIWLALGSQIAARSDGPFDAANAYFEAPVDGRYVVFLLVAPAYAFAAVLWFAYALATSGLMDRSEDRSLPLKRWTLAVLAAGVAIVTGWGNTTRQLDRDWTAAVSMFSIASVAIGLLFVFAGEPVSPSRRMQVNPPSSVDRLLFPRCLAPSLLFPVVSGGLALVAVPVLLGASSRLGVDAAWGVTFLAALAGAMGSVAAKRGAATARRAGAAALIGLTIGVLWLRANSTGRSLADAVCPLWLDPDDARGAWALGFALLGWTTAAFASVVSMLRLVRAADRRQAPAVPGGP
ncbi:MAG TPA: hypothetical protein VKU41_30325 [Polyangiaceae bacterium]|nr:hypothetical protein [Polyangiaceae bacterium]